MNGITAKGLPENQAAWVGLISRLTFNDLAMKYRKVGLVECEVISHGLLISMIGYADPIPTNCVNYILDVHNFSV